MDKLKDIFPDRFENLGIFLFILGLTFLINWLARRAFNRFMRLRTTDIKVDLTNYKFLGNALSTIIFTVGIMFAIREYPPLRTVAGSVLAGAGILAAIIGFASQQAFSNIISGIFIIIFKPFRVNDRLRIKEIYSGIVEDITLRHTVLRDDENRRVIVPNAVINSEILVNSDYNDEAK
jgi:small conductance mechanosensitive channel